MAFANPSYTDVLATTIEARSKVIADNVSKNTALLARLNEKGNIRTVDGGVTILEELSFQENGNAQWYSGGDLLSVAAQDVISAASYPWSQAAVAIVINGLEQLQNSGRERMIDLMAGRVRVGETSLKNLIAGGIYSDGTGFGGKQLTGLNAAVPLSNTTGTYGGINRATFPFWQSQLVAPGAGVITAANINTYMNQLWLKCVRNKDKVDLIVADNAMFALYLAFLQNLQRFVKAETGKLGFPSLSFIDADVVLDGGIGGFCPANQMFFLNTDYIFFRPHKDRNMVPLNPGKRYATNQDAEVQLVGFAGQMTVSGDQFQGRLSNS
jgi:hypothetical protein